MDEDYAKEQGGAYFQGPSIDWLIVGGESGKKARPMHPDWARSLRDQCRAAMVPFFFKQVGSWTSWQPSSPPEWQNCFTNKFEDGHVLFHGVNFDRDPNWDDGLNYDLDDSHVVHHRVGKKAAGRLLDGRTWDQMPGVV